jgi:FdhD protein
MKQQNKPGSSVSRDSGLEPGDGSANGSTDIGGADATIGISSELSSTFQVEDWRSGRSTAVSDQIIEEQAIALVYNGISHVVMMATPDHLEDFALGFSLSEGILGSPTELYEIELSKQEVGIQVAMEISAERFAALKEVRRNMTGRTGCGLCGAESLQQAVRQPQSVPLTQQFSHEAIEHAVRQLEANQPLQAVTGAVHGAAWCDDKGNIELIREDVGRHNALDKLYGALCQNTIYRGERFQDRRPDSETGGKRSKNHDGHFALISSRASYEMVVKAAVMGVEMLVAVSAPTRLAIDLAQRVNLTLVGFARPGRHMVYTHAQRIL